MKMKIIGRQTEVPEALSAVAVKRLAKLDKFFGSDAEAILKLKKKRSIEVVELTVQSAGHLFRSEKSGESYQNALDEAVDAIIRQIRKNKTRLEKRLREGAFREEPDAASLPEEPEEKELSVRYKSFRFKPMSPEEAILQMQLIGHSFFVFENDATGKVNVVYTKAGRRLRLHRAGLSGLAFP